MGSINHPRASSLLSRSCPEAPSSSGHPASPRRCAYPIYDLTSPIFSAEEAAWIFSPPPEAAATLSDAGGWTAPLNARIKHITGREAMLSPVGICVGEYTSQSVAHPSLLYGVGQVFHNWNIHPATKKFREMIASTPVVQSTGNCPAHILKGYLDELGVGRSPLEQTWVLKFLLLPKKVSDGWWMESSVQRGDWCDPPAGWEKKVKNVALVCVRDGIVGMKEKRRKLVEFGKLFSVEVVLVPSLR